MANNITPKLKAFVRIDGSGRVIPGGPIFQASKPKVGNWREIPMYYRGTTGTTTTQGGGGDMPTAWVITGYASYSDACNNINPQTSIGYTPTSALGDAVTLWEDAALTIPFNQNANGYNLLFAASPEFSNCYFNTTGGAGATYIFSCTQCF